MRPINLIPAEDRRGERAPLRAGPLSYFLVGVLLLAFVGVYVVVSTGNTISERESAIASLEQRLDSTQARAEALRSFTDFASLEQTRTATVAGLARSRFDWERVLRELALVIPSDVSLDSIAGAVGSADVANPDGASTAAASVEGIAVPTLTMAGCGSGHESVARLVAALRDIDGVTRVGLASSAEEEETSTAAGTPASSAPAEAGAECAGAASFELTVAFDGVQIDPAAAGTVPPAPVPEPDATGVADAQPEQDAAKESAGSATEKGRKAVDTFIPGA